MMINKIQFLMTFSWNIPFGMSEALEIGKQIMLIQCIKNVVACPYGWTV
jgi:hypothetical protein